MIGKTEGPAWRRLLLPATLGIAAYYAVFGGEYNVFEAWRMDRMRETEAEVLAELRSQVDSLRARASALETDDPTIERVARERYGMIREGEILYRFVEDDATAVRGSATQQTPR